VFFLYLISIILRLSNKTADVKVNILMGMDGKEG